LIAKGGVYCELYELQRHPDKSDEPVST